MKIYRTKRMLLAAVILMFVLLPVFASAEGIDTAKIMKALDNQKNILTHDFSSVMTMIAEDPDTGVEKSVIQQFRRDSEDKFVMLFRQPEVKKGQGYLRVDDNLWFYDPESRKFTHSSMKEQFGGSDARNSDFGKSTFSEDYSVVSASEGKLGSFDVYILNLKANNNEVTYPTRKFWVTKDSSLILKTEDYSETGRLMRTALYPGYAKVENYYIPSRMIFIDNLVKGKKTQITMTDISLAKLPDSVFTKSYLQRVNR